MLIFRQLFDQASSTYTYLLGDSDSRQAILIDPVFEQIERDTALLHELGLNLVKTIETHVHADHVTGGWMLRERFGSVIGISDRAGADCADFLFTEGDTVDFGTRHLTVLATPGHTDGCSTFVLDDASMAFTGDCLLIRGCGRTDFQQGSAETLFHSVRDKIFALPDSCLLYPGHDYRGSTVTSVAEEKRHNPRLGLAIQLEDFRGYMHLLGLPHPKKIDVAVPANMKCGAPEDEGEATTRPEWAPLAYTYAGFWEIEPQWLEENRGAAQIVDVREVEEFTGVLGHIEGATLIPLGELSGSLEMLDKELPVVTVCRSGARSAQAASKLQQAGFNRVANLAGGMLRWRSLRLPVEGEATETGG